MGAWNWRPKNGVGAYTDKRNAYVDIKKRGWALTQRCALTRKNTVQPVTQSNCPSTPYMYMYPWLHCAVIVKDIISCWSDVLLKNQCFNLTFNVSWQFHYSEESAYRKHRYDICRVPSRCTGIMIFIATWLLMTVSCIFLPMGLNLTAWFA